MKTLTVTQFKAQFGQLTKECIPILVRNRKVPVGVWQPLDARELKARRADVLRGFVALGRSVRRDIARRHDEYLYGKTGAVQNIDDTGRAWHTEGGTVFIRYKDHEHVTRITSRIAKEEL